MNLTNLAFVEAPGCIDSCLSLYLGRFWPLFLQMFFLLLAVSLLFIWDNIMQISHRSLRLTHLFITILTCTPQWQLIHSHCCATITLLVPIYYVTSIGKPIPCASYSPFSQLLTSTNLLSVSMDLPIPDISYQSNHTEWSLRLFPFT